MRHIPEYWIPSSIYAAIFSLGWMFSNSRRKDSIQSPTVGIPSSPASGKKGWAIYKDGKVVGQYAVMNGT